MIADAQLGGHEAPGRARYLHTRPERHYSFVRARATYPFFSQTLVRSGPPTFGW